MGIEEAPKEVARTAESAPAFEWFARAGFAAVGVIHILVGSLVLVLAFGGKAEGSQSGALQAIASAPAGFIVLWVLAIALWCLAVWEVFDGILGRGTARHRWQRRVSDFSRALGYLVFGGIAVAVALGSKPNPDRSAKSLSGGLIATPGGVFVLAAVGIGIGVAGVVFAVIGIRRSFRKKLMVPPGARSRLITASGVVGYLAKGLALVVVGILLVVAAITLDPKAAGGLDAAMSALLALPFGGLLTGAVGVGLAVYGLYCFLRARYAKL